MPNKTTAAYIGHIDNVLSGRVPEELRDVWVDAASFKYAFEIGSPEGIESLGETIVLNGLVYTKSTATFKLVSGERLCTTGLFIIPKRAEPAEIISGKGPLTATELYSQLYKRLGCPFAYVGTVTFKTLHATAISKAPIHNESIFDHKEAYFAYPPVEEEDTSAAIMGAATDFGVPSPLNEKLSVVLYKNPFEKPGEINAHSHILKLKKLVDIPQISPSVAADVLHLFPQSEVASYSLELYPLKDLVDFNTLKS